jgi:hypothetical protein
MSHQFNIGDKIVNLRNIELWDHPNHHAIFLNSVTGVVLQADSQHFSIRPNINISDVHSASQVEKDDIYEQESGVCIGLNPNFILHPVRDRDVILASLDKALNNSMQALENRYLSKVPTQNISMSDLMVELEKSRGNVHYYAAAATAVKNRYDEVINKIFN